MRREGALRQRGTQRYTYGSERIPIDHIDTGAMSAATGLYSTASRSRALTGGALRGRQPAHRRGCETPDAARRVEDRRRQTPEYGLGFEIVTIGEQHVLGHGGGYPGHITRTYFDPKDRLAVCVFTNAIDGPALGMAYAAIKLVDLARRSEPDPAAAGADAVDLETFCGRFASLWSVYDIAVLGGRLYQLSPGLVDPAWRTQLDVVNSDTLRIADTVGYGCRGETVDRPEAAGSASSSMAEAVRSPTRWISSRAPHRGP